MTKKRTYAKYALEATALLGEQIKLERKRRKWSEANLAERAGISRATLQKIEHGEMTCAIGLFFEVAMLVGINLFEHDDFPLSRQLKQTKNSVALLPKRIKSKTTVAHDDF